MPVDIDSIFRGGGKRLLDLLDFCVRAVEMDPLFLFLVQEYQYQPTTPRAMALYQLFCAVDAPARISAGTLLPPRNPLLELALQPVRASWLQRQAMPASAAPAAPAAYHLPSKYLFDTVALHLRETSPALRRVRRRYRVRRSPIENLPDGRMNQAQRRFIDQVWQPILRPRLVTAGFRQVTAIG